MSLSTEREYNKKRKNRNRILSKRGARKILRRCEENQESYPAQVREKEFQVTVKEHDQPTKQKKSSKVK